MVKESSHIGERINVLLKQQGMTQRELASRIGRSDITVCRIVNGVNIPRQDTIVNISRVLGTTVDDLLGIEDNFDLAYVDVRNWINVNSSRMTVKQKKQISDLLFPGRRGRRRHCNG